MHRILEYCINKLQDIKSKLIDPVNVNETCNGILTANHCIRDSIETRCSLIEEIYGEPELEPGQVWTDSNYALFCLEFTESLEQLFREDLSEMGNTEFERGYKSQVRKFLSMFQPLQDELKRIATDHIYNT